MSTLNFVLKDIFLRVQTYWPPGGGWSGQSNIEINFKADNNGQKLYFKIVNGEGRGALDHITERTLDGRLGANRDFAVYEHGGYRSHPTHYRHEVLHWTHRGGEWLDRLYVSLDKENWVEMQFPKTASKASTQYRTGNYKDIDYQYYNLPDVDINVPVITPADQRQHCSRFKKDDQFPSLVKINNREVKGITYTGHKIWRFPAKTSFFYPYLHRLPPEAIWDQDRNCFTLHGNQISD